MAIPDAVPRAIPDDVEDELSASDSPAVRKRPEVQRAVAQVIDSLAPEVSLTRGTRPRQTIDRYRTPRGCMLQGDDVAVSVSWFPDPAAERTNGEMIVAAWTGTLSVPGSARRREAGAAVRAEVVFTPVWREPGDLRVPGVWGWQNGDGAIFDTEELTRYCLSLLSSEGAH